ncbi:DUF885 family protein [Streptomyces sp. NPDC004050]
MSLPDTGWPRAQSDPWLSTGLNRTLMPNMALHEVAPGHAGHGRALRRAATDVRRTLHSDAFIEGWTHYGEELALEQGFRGGDPRVAVAVAQDALRRVTRFACAIGFHTGAMTLPDAAARFTRDVSPSGPAARHEAERGLFDLAILDLREQAAARWGGAFSRRRFHTALFDLDAPPLGLLHTALERGWTPSPPAAGRAGRTPSRSAPAAPPLPRGRPRRRAQPQGRPVPPGLPPAVRAPPAAFTSAWLPWSSSGARSAAGSPSRRPGRSVPRRAGLPARTGTLADRKATHGEPCGLDCARSCA